MNIDKFKAGTLKKQFGYSSFSPELVNHEWLITLRHLDNNHSDEHYSALGFLGDWL